ncbi:penicillin-binding protein 2 [Patescibacteria group bacterium]
MPRVDPFKIFGTTEEIKDPVIDKYVQSRWQGDEYSPERSNQSKEEITVPRNRYMWLSIVVSVAIFLIIVRVFSLQIVSGAEYRDKAENNRIKLEVISAPRGIIFDRHGSPFVENVPNFSIWFNAQDKSDDQSYLENISAISSTSIDDIKNAINESNDLSNVEIRTGVEYFEALDLKVKLKDIEDVNLMVNAKRIYPSGPAFSHLLGYTGLISPEEFDIEDRYLFNDYIGKEGIEKEYEKYLDGTDGGQQIERDSKNSTQRIIASADPVPGDSITLTVDSNLQNVLYTALENEVENNVNATGGAAVAIDPRTGAILSLVSYPSYDNNQLYSGDDEGYINNIFNDPRTPLFNRAISGEYPPGSTIKPLIATAALQEGTITENTTILSTGGFQIKQWYFPDWKSGGHGVTDVRKAIAESVNTFFYTIGGGRDDYTGLGISNITNYARRFGLGDQLGIDLPNESSGFLPSKEWKEETKGESWYIGDTYHAAIGQGDILVTPLQVASVTATIANGGTVYRPHLLEKINNYQNDNIKTESIEALRENIISPYITKIVREGMRQAVTSGSSRALSNFKVPVAGKTGTAQTAGETYHAWFTGFAPYDSPEIVITAMVENGGEGHTAALPVVREGLSEYFKQ